MVASGTVTVDQLFEVRLLIEPHIARQAARHATSSDIKKLEQLLQDSAAHLDDPVYLKKNNLNFHLLLARACGNPVMSILMESVFELLIESSLDFLDLSLERRFFEVHRKTFQLIKKKKPEESAKAMRKDILDVKKRLKGFKKKNLDD
jgi:GntR family transcriptional repressor for pyruvate dehydrogenase complex